MSCGWGRVRHLTKAKELDCAVLQLTFRPGGGRRRSIMACRVGEGALSRHKARHGQPSSARVASTRRHTNSRPSSQSRGPPDEGGDSEVVVV